MHHRFAGDRPDSRTLGDTVREVRVARVLVVTPVGEQIEHHPVGPGRRVDVDPQLRGHAGQVAFDRSAVGVGVQAELVVPHGLRPARADRIAQAGGRLGNAVSAVDGRQRRPILEPQSCLDVVLRADPPVAVDVPRPEVHGRCRVAPQRMP